MLGLRTPDEPIPRTGASLPWDILFVAVGQGLATAILVNRAKDQLTVGVVASAAEFLGAVAVTVAILRLTRPA